MLKSSNGIGKHIRALRKMQHLTQAELGAKCGLERTSITNIEMGRQALTTNSINAIAEALGYKVHVTFRRKERP